MVGVIGPYLYMGAITDESGSELWRTDGLNASLVADINIGANGSFPFDFTSTNDYSILLLMMVFWVKNFGEYPELAKRQI